MRPMERALIACSCCGLILEVPPVPPKSRARCPRCRSAVRDPHRPPDLTPSLASAIAALILYPFAILTPVMRLERLGHVHESSIWDGAVSLLVHGDWFTGALILFCSVLLPLAKICAILFLNLSSRLAPNHQALTYKLVEHSGRWGMLDVLLVAVLVAALKLGDLVAVEPGPGATVFATFVVMSLIASATFDNHALWRSRR